VTDDIEEREASHQHYCSRCGREWGHWSRTCNGGEDMKCMECDEGGPGKIEEPEDVPAKEGEDTPGEAKEDGEEGEEGEGEG